MGASRERERKLVGVAYAVSVKTQRFEASPPTQRSRGVNDTRQLASYSDSTRSKLCLNSARVSSTRNVNESSRATRNSTQKACEKLGFFVYKILIKKNYISTLGDDINNISIF